MFSFPLSAIPLPIVLPFLPVNIRVLARYLNLTTFLLNWEFSNPPLLSLLPAVLRRENFLNNKCPTLAETIFQTNSPKVTIEK